MAGAVTLNAVAVVAVLSQLYGCVAIAPAGIARPPGPRFEPHVQMQPGTAIVYLYYFETRFIESDLPVSVTQTAGRIGLEFFVNGKRAAPLILGGYTVIEVEPGEIVVEIRHPKEATANPMRSPVYQSKLTFRAYANEPYYVRSRTVVTKIGNGPIGLERELTVERAFEQVALRDHLPRLRRQEPYL